MKKYADVDAFLEDTNRWHDEIVELRAILLGTKLEEAIKWGKPCYGDGENNVAIVQPMKNFLALLFVKGALLDDPKGLLEEQGSNTRSARRLCFTSVAEVKKAKTAIRGLVRSAKAVEASGAKLPPRGELVLVAELEARLAKSKKLKSAFEKLTPGRQREYNLHIESAKQAKTRAARVEKQVERILAGKGLRDR